MAGAPCLLWAKIDEACLVGMEHKPEPSKTPTQDRQDALGIVNVGKCHDRVVSIPGQGAIPGEARSHLGLEPVVQHVVQKDVRKAGRYHASLRRTLGRAEQEAIFNGSRFQPFIDHPSDDTVCDSFVEERPKVGV